MTPVDDRDYFFCAFCGGYHFPESSDEGVTILAVASANVSCAVCRTPLSLASIEELKLLHCENCRGTLAPYRQFAELVTRLRSKSRETHTPRPLDRAQFERRLACPRCAQTMETHPYYGPGNVVIDSCHACRVVWLDHGELTAIAKAPGRGKGE